MLFEVWAPRAKQVALVLEDRRVAMSSQARGWWRVDVPEAGAGVRYAFALDDGPPRPDPRSLDQPDGVHGFSRVFHQRSYVWRIGRFCAPPLSSAVLYELHIGTFTPDGTLAGAIQRLDHLVDLGVTHVELMPVNAFDGQHGWGYDGVCWYAPHPAWTGPEGPNGLKRFVDACHERGLAVILDVVYNHLGPSGNYLAEFGPYFSESYSTPWGPAINLDGPGSDDVRRFICDNALMWLRDYRFDALRLDAVHAFHDRSAVHLLEQLCREVRLLEAAEGRQLVIIAESDLNDPRLVRSVEAGGFGCDAQWSDDFHHALHAVLTGERSGYYADFGELSHLATALRRAFVYDGVYSAFRQRRHGRPITSAAGSLPGDRFLGYIQNHDQVGNRATGDRLASLVDDQRVLAAAAIVLLAPFVPMLFQGEEWGTRRPFQYFTDHSDPALATAVREGRRAEFEAFGWRAEDVPDPQNAETFRRSILDWTEPQEERCTRVLQWYKQLVALRRSTPGLAAGPLEQVAVRFDEAERWLAFRRGGVEVVCSFAGDGRLVEVPLALRAGEQERCRVLLSSADGNRVDRECAVLRPGAVVVLAWDREENGSG